MKIHQIRIKEIEDMDFETRQLWRLDVYIVDINNLMEYTKILMMPCMLFKQNGSYKLGIPIKLDANHILIGELIQSKSVAVGLIGSSEDN